MDPLVSCTDDLSEKPSHFMLYHYDAAGAVNRERLLASNSHDPPTTYHLIDDTTIEASSTVKESTAPEYSIARLELYKTHAALSVFREIECGSWVLPSRSDELPFRMPISSETSKTLVILRQDDHFITSSGRWSVTLMKRSSTNFETEKASDTGPMLARFPPVGMAPPPPKPHDHDLNNAQSTIAIHTDLPAEDASPTRDESQEDMHLKDLSINLRSQAENAKYSDGTTREPYRSIFGKQAVQPATEELDNLNTVAASPPPPQEEAMEDTVNSAAVEEEHKENRGTKLTIKRAIRRKAKQTTYSTTRQVSSSMKRKSGALSEPSDEESDTVPVTPRSAKTTQGISSRKSSSRKSRKVGVSGSPLDPTMSLGALDASPPMPNVAPSVPKRNRASSAKVYQGHPPKVIFSSSTTVNSRTKIMESFRSFGGSVTKCISKADILCVSSGALKKSTKFVSAVALGIDIVDERWLVESHRKSALLNPEAFVPKDAEHEREWGFDLKAAIERGREGLSDLLEATHVYFTRQLEIDLGGNFKDFCKIAKMLGADSMGVTLPTETKTEETIIVIGMDNDPQAPSVRALGLVLYHRDLLVMGVLRGVVDLESEEFKLEVPIKTEADD